MSICLSDGLMQEDYDDEEFVYSDDEPGMDSAFIPTPSSTPTSANRKSAREPVSSAQDACGEQDEGDEDDYYAGSDDELIPVTDIEPTKNTWAVDFKVHGFENLQARQEEMVNNLEALLAISKDSTTLLLRCYQWKDEKLVEEYLADPNKILEKYGVFACPPEPVMQSGNAEFTCHICYCDGADEEYMELACGHGFCTTCYKSYISLKVQEGESWQIRCPEPKCKTLLGDRATRLILDKEMEAKYTSNLTKSFVRSIDSLTWCPAPNCIYAIECLVPRSAMDMAIPTVNCKCGKAFCFGCKLDGHLPAPCSLVKKWLKKCEDDSETANWLKVNTKECPQCKSTIEKNRGCNHMTCRECHHEFCWVCMGPWNLHGQSFYSCNRYEEDASKEARESISKSRAMLERYMHYFTRYNNHEQSAKFAQQLLATTEKNMEHMQREMSLAWIEVHFFSDALDVLTACRAVLKWSYVLAYYMVSDNQKIIFENN
ncbi:hypothetical protein GGI02_004821, partial [Coemansia sp. RSA 2322]